MSRAVRFDHFGEVDVLHVDQVPTPSPEAGEVLVRVRAAGVNPGEAAIRSGLLAAQAPSRFPSGQGTEFAGRVERLGADVAGYAVGDAVIGFSDGRDAQADHVVVPAANVLPKPEGLEWGVAATMPIAGATAMSMLDSVGIAPGDVVVVAGGAGGVGFAAVQLALLAGASVVATARVTDHDALRAVGAIPVEYGPGVATRIRSAAPTGVDAFLDTYGHGQADLAVALGVPVGRIDSIIDFEAGSRLGIHNDGMYQLHDIRMAVVRFADLVATGVVRSPVKARFPLEQVRQAYRALTEAPGVGKVVLDISDDADPTAGGPQ